MTMRLSKELLQERYEIRGDEEDFVAAKDLYERALEATPTAETLQQYGYLLYCHGRRELRRATEQYRRALELDPRADKARYMLIGTLADLRDGDEMVALYERAVTDDPADVRNHRFLVNSYLAARDHQRALVAAAAGLERCPGDRVLIELRGDARAGQRDVEGALDRLARSGRGSRGRLRDQPALQQRIPARERRPAR
ncbi:MAG TPA: hypothetical protein VKS25_10415 [Solirubrobacteraceae bacterium]|nr:hypothetical protein [Solirubrobacteraceae bacterium]